MSQLDIFRLDERVALIPGGGGAIGSALAVALAGAGARIAVTGRTQEALDAAAARVADAGSECLVVTADMTDRAAAEDVVALTVDRFGRLDIILNSIGGGAGKVSCVILALLTRTVIYSSTCMKLIGQPRC